MRQPKSKKNLPLQALKSKLNNNFFVKQHRLKRFVCDGVVFLHRLLEY